MECYICSYRPAHDINDDASLMIMIYLSYMNTLIQIHDNAIMIALLILDQITYLLDTNHTKRSLQIALIVNLLSLVQSSWVILK